MNELFDLSITGAVIDHPRLILIGGFQIRPKSAQRTYPKEEIPAPWLGHMARVDVTKIRRVVERNGRSRMRRLNGTSNHQRQPAALAGGAPQRNTPRRSNGDGSGA